MTVPVYFRIRCPKHLTSEIVKRLNKNQFIIKTVIQKDSSFFDNSATAYLKEKNDFEDISCMAETDSVEQSDELKSYLYLYLVHFDVEVLSFDVPDYKILKDKHVLYIAISTAGIVFITLLVHNMALATHEMGLMHKINWIEVFDLNNIFWNGITPVIAGLGALGIEIFFHKRVEYFHKIHSIK
ncbi:MAG TPA: hypothetical protein VN703_00385 [Candidatus Sulfopaludibacter sp.]|nr:hypothetical protein [Candidatus Sulfopaludibacter sp.]